MRLGSSVLSDFIVSNTGAPQGTVLAPFLFVLYTSDVRSNDPLCPLIKFADDTALVGLIERDDCSNYINHLHNFIDYCDNNFLELNVKKNQRNGH